MDAIRCLDCADVRWSLLGLKGRQERCSVCGGEMVPERRRPDGLHVEPVERRGLALAHTPAADEHRPTA